MNPTTITGSALSLTFSDGVESLVVPKSAIKNVSVYGTKYAKVDLESWFTKSLTFSSIFADYNVVTNPSAASAAALVTDITTLIYDQGTLDNIGAAGASTITADESGDSIFHKTVLTLTNFVVGAIPGAGALGIGANVYTLPTGVQIIDSAYINLYLSNDDGNIDADTPDLGLGSVIASGAVSVLSGTPTFENIMTGQTMDDCNGAYEEAAVSQAYSSITGGSKNIFLNVADTWAGAETELKATGTITLFWKTV